MDNIKIFFSNKVVELAINQNKLILGNNYHKKFEIIKSIRQYFEKKNYSEYQQVNNHRCQIEFNENRLDNRGWELFEINNFFDLNNDIKLGSKSLLVKYFETSLKDIEYNESVNTINILLEDLSKEFYEIKEIKDVDLSVSFQPLNYKTIIKLLNLSVLRDGIEANGYDLSYEQLIIFQLNLIKEIGLNENTKNLLLSLTYQF